MLRQIICLYRKQPRRQELSRVTSEIADGMHIEPGDCIVVIKKDGTVGKVVMPEMNVHMQNSVGYKKLFPEMNFEIAAILVSRIISKPKKNIICLDLGHKSVASEMPLPRVIIHGLENAKHINQSEEHLIIESKRAKNYNIGDLVYATPFHICPTVSKFEYIQTISNGEISSLWKVKARNYNLKSNVFNF